MEWPNRSLHHWVGIHWQRESRATLAISTWYNSYLLTVGTLLSLEWSDLHKIKNIIFLRNQGQYQVKIWACSGITSHWKGSCANILSGYLTRRQDHTGFPISDLIRYSWILDRMPPQVKIYSISLIWCTSTKIQPTKPWNTVTWGMSTFLYSLMYHFRHLCTQ